MVTLRRKMSGKTFGKIFYRALLRSVIHLMIVVVGMLNMKLMRATLGTKHISYSLGKKGCL